MRPATHRCTAALLGLLLVSLLAVPASASGPSDELFWRVNEARTDRGLAPLARFPTQEQVVRANDDYAATQDPHRLNQQNMDFYAGFGANAYAENQGVGSAGTAPARIVSAWIGSPGHANNLFSSSATHLAVAVTTASGNTVFTAHMITAPSVDTSDPGPSRPGGSDANNDTNSDDASTSSQSDDSNRTDAGAGGHGPDGDTSGGETAAEPEGAAETEPAQPEEPVVEAPAPLLPEPLGRDELERINTFDMAITEGSDSTDAPDWPTGELDELALLAANDIDMTLATADLDGATPASLPGMPTAGGALLVLLLAMATLVSGRRRAARQRTVRAGRRSRTPRGRTRRARIEAAKAGNDVPGPA